MPKKPKNPTDPNLLARAVVEAAIGEPLTPSKAKLKHQPGKKMKEAKRGKER